MERGFVGHGGAIDSLTPICPVCESPAHVAQRHRAVKPEQPLDIYGCGYCGIVFDLAGRTGNKAGQKH